MVNEEELQWPDLVMLVRAVEGLPDRGARALQLLMPLRLFSELVERGFARPVVRMLVGGGRRPLASAQHRRPHALGDLVKKCSGLARGVTVRVKKLPPP
jgi:hypothetical protein